jgi:chemotaxis protein methyltransferase CheR
MVEVARMTSPPPASRLRPLQRGDFLAIRDFVYREAGIHLADSKRALVESRLSRRIKELSLPSYAAYRDLVLEAGDPDEQVRMLDCLTTNETRFFREPKHFDFLNRVAIPEWKAQAAARRTPQRLRAWSAACSTGEEPYSLAMTMLDAFPAGWQLEVLASDLSTRALRSAEQATWPIDRASEIPEQHCKKYMLRGVGPEAGKLRCGKEVRELVRCFRLNLHRPPFAVPGELDMIFCRNVMIYFDTASKQRVIEGLLDRLAPHGYLFIGHSETLHGITRRASLVAPSVYRRCAEGERAAR